VPARLIALLLMHVSISRLMRLTLLLSAACSILAISVEQEMREMHAWYCSDSRAKLLPCVVWRARTAVQSDGKPTPNSQQAAAEVLKQHSQETLIEQMQDMHTAWCTEGLAAQASWLDRSSSYVCGDLSDEAEEIDGVAKAAQGRVWGGKGSQPGKGGAGGKAGASGRKGGKGAAEDAENLGDAYEESLQGKKEL